MAMLGPMPQCPVEKECLVWVQRYLKDCVCSGRDRVSLTLGLISVGSWGVAEVPQILTNFRQKSTEGVSLLFLMTWVVGDVFNLAGCYLEPATLPTQFYMAMLYTITTIVLVGQTIYYDHLALWWWGKQDGVEDLFPEAQKADVEAQKPVSIPESVDETRESTSVPSQPTSISVPHPHRQSPSSRDQLYYMSARSLASSYAPTAGSYSVGSRGSGGGQGSYLLPREDSLPFEPVPADSRQSRSSSNSLSSSLLRTAVESDGSLSLTRMMTVLVVTYVMPGLLTFPVVEMASGALVVGSMGLSSHINRIPSGSIVGTTFAGRSGRSLLQISSAVSGFQLNQFSTGLLRQKISTVGEVFGWFMAAIYMGGRIPQIWLNIKRGTVEGLNPLMFVFALVGNATYVGSILVRSFEWTQLKPNLPWLVDAGVCVLLDIFILCQFGYFYSKKPKVVEEVDSDRSGPYKPLTP